MTRLNLRGKSILLMMLTGFTALAFAVSAFIGYEILMFRQSAENENLAIARILALNSMASLSFQDKITAQDTLKSLDAETTIRAALYDRQGQLFTQSLGTPTSRPFPPTIARDEALRRTPAFRWDGLLLSIHVPIFLEGEYLGMVLLQAEQRQLFARLTDYLTISAVIFLLSCAPAYALSVFSQRFITAPVTALQQTMEQVATTHDYSLRAIQGGTDEIGALAVRFNSMLDQIQAQDQELRHRREMLEEHVRLRTEELSATNDRLRAAVEELRAAKEMAESASQAKMRFLANISHEIRTPMNGVLGIAEILAKSSLSDRQRQLLQTLQQSGSDLMGIINDLLDFSKLEAGKFDLNIATFNLQTLLDNCIGVFSANANAKHLEVACLSDPDVPTMIQADPDRIRQILVNLLSNAIKFTSQGSVVLHAALGRIRGTQGTLRLTVRDTGTGIEHKALTAIFSPFTQADDTMTRAHGGTGLGLAIVHQLVHLMEGTIDVRSEPGQGSEFIVAIPFVYPENNTENPNSELFSSLRVGTLGMTPLYRQTLNNILGRVGINPLHHDSVVELVHAHGGRTETTLLFVNDDGRLPCDEHLFATLRSGLGPKPVLLLLSADAAEPCAAVTAVLTKPPRQSEIHNILREAAGIAAPPIPQEHCEDERFEATVLLVEDNEVNQRVATAALELFGLRVDVAENGKTAVIMATGKPYDLVFMDCQMPVMDGYSATARIREWEAAHRPGKRTPIVALTAHALDKDRQRCFQHGMDEYLTKPFTMTILHQCLLRWLPPTTRRPQAAATEGAAPAVSPLQDDQILDSATIESLRAMQRKGSPDLLHRLFAAYERSSRELLRGMETALTARDATTLRQHAHTLKSSSANIGALRLSKLAASMEQQVRDDTLDDIADLHRKLAEEHRLVLDALQTCQGTR